VKNLPYKKVLVLAPHIDDGEFGCGGTIARLVSDGCEVKYVAFSDCKESLPEGLSPDTLRLELIESMSKLGVSENQATVLDYKVRYFERDRQEILQSLIDIKKEFNPDFVLTPSPNDIHQDHQVISAESIRAYKDCTILGYELPWNCFQLPSKVIIELDESHLTKKTEAIKCYKSQEHRPYHNSEYIKALALTRGLRIKKKYAEAFEPIRIVY